MDFLKSFLRNLLFLAAIFLVILFLFPDWMTQVYSLFGSLFGPLLILIVATTALPRRSRRRSRW